MTRAPRSRVGVAAVGAFALLASLLTPALATAADGPPTAHDLIFSEYVEGSSDNKALEIYNGTAAAIDLSTYSIQLFSNGAAKAGFTLPLSGTLEPSDVYVVAHTAAASQILTVADVTTASGLFNGDDALTLRNGSAVVDSIGQVGVDPGTRWGTPPVSTVDTTLRRLASVCGGDTVPDDVFEPSAQWEGFAKDSFDGLGTHRSDCVAGDLTVPDPDPDPTDVCETVTSIGAVQGSGAASPMVGAVVCIEGVVVGDFQQIDSLDGYYVQDAGDGDSATSDGIFVFAPSGAEVAVGDQVRVGGNVAEFYGMTQLSLTTLEVVASDAPLPAAAQLALPLADPEVHEGMLVTFEQELAILEYFNYGRYGEIVLGVGDQTPRQHQPTAVFEPGSTQAQALATFNLSHRITLDDGMKRQNPSTLRHPNGGQFGLDNLFRGGDTVGDLTGILDYRNNAWKIQPTQGADYEVKNARPGVPDVGGSTTVASFNVLNYFTTLPSQDSTARGADTQKEFVRQQDKIVAAINAMDADVTGLIEIENNGDVAVGNLVAALNTAAGAQRWAFVSTGPVGTDVITTAFIYQPAQVTPVGEHAVLDSSVDERFLDDFNRPALAQTFEDNVNGGVVTVIVNHLKSKGSGCDAAGDPQDPNGQGNCNGVRTEAADALGDWANADPTGSGTDHALIIGDLNSYDKEDPIDALKADGYTDLMHAFQGEYAYSYVFDGMLGYLDYAMASQSLAPRVTGTQGWAINADEPSVLDYDMSFKPAAQDALYAPDAFRSSDHDPVLIGLDLADTVAPQLEVIASPSSIWPPNNKWVTVNTVVTASDDSGAAPAVTLVGAVVTKRGVNGKAAIKVVSDSQFRVKAVKGAVYTITYEATDAAGNTTVTSVSVTVSKG
ncbi:MAG: ExeM/NucH family extracellular endonuclease [Ornithinimicrobium sp.]|uniref:ExeM/NucH family extracellular endonuclease n=1 Tax=Ornithinimicrobium sp. TaxID=1977084 RepID=UPI0026DECE04|nr:ExeM/NucH family extracellular endonuclease [Ornithinimicrobium sp.]MDO5739554.1 ExeM/NucH family extracellular endonuclease [Ornithinimicrobium sp.]